jgi:hypothetical protein
MRIAVLPLQAIRNDFAVGVSTRRHLQLMLQNAPMFYASCRAAVINAPVDVVLALLAEPAAWGGAFASWHQIRVDRRSSDKRSAVNRPSNPSSEADVSDDRDRSRPSSP